jgi:hypothetical protein
MICFVRAAHSRLVEKEGFSTHFILAQFRADFFQRNDTMKKLATLLLAAGMVVASTAPASAADVKLDGFYRYTFQTASTGFNGVNQEATQQRMRLGLTIAASENLSGYTQFQLGTNDFGSAPKHGKMDVQARQYYIDWQVPATPVKVRMGRQGLGLPADAFGGNNFANAYAAPSGNYGGYAAPAGNPASDFAMLEDDDAQLPF